jgi:hypothetical protein
MQHDTGLVAAIGLDRSGNAVYTQREQPWKKVFQP